jgi:hypothetical protein
LSRIIFLLQKLCLRTIFLWVVRRLTVYLLHGLTLLVFQEVPIKLLWIMLIDGQIGEHGFYLWLERF